VQTNEVTPILDIYVDIADLSEDDKVYEFNPSDKESPDIDKIEVLPLSNVKVCV
jgi:hypothetical protein